MKEDLSLECCDGDGIGCNTDISEFDENEGVQSGLGVRISRETRDNRFNARKGSYLFLQYTNYGNWIGSKFDYHSLIFDYRKYVTPVKWLTVAGIRMSVNKATRSNIRFDVGFFQAQPLYFFTFSEAF